MRAIDPTVKRETLYIALCTLILSLMMQAVFLVLHKWDFTVLLGNLFGGAVCVLNFFLMGLSVQSALEKEEKDAQTTMRLSQHLRMLMLLVLVALGAALPFFNLWAVLIPLLFPRIAVTIRPLFDKKIEGGDG